MCPRCAPKRVRGDTDQALTTSGRPFLHSRRLGKLCSRHRWSQRGRRTKGGWAMKTVHAIYRYTPQEDDVWSTYSYPEGIYTIGASLPKVRARFEEAAKVHYECPRPGTRPWRARAGRVSKSACRLPRSTVRLRPPHDLELSTRALVINRWPRPSPPSGQITESG
jgi:hypothetical protein